MTRIVFVHTSASATLADALRQELCAKGYIVPDHPLLNAQVGSRQRERAIVGCAAVVVFWEQSVAAAWEAVVLPTVQRFPKPLFPIVLDATPLPQELAALPTLAGQLTVGPTVAALVGLPGFPSARSVDPLQILYEEATDEIIRIERAAIERAASMLPNAQQRDAVVALLTYLAAHDPLSTMQTLANKVLLDDARQRVPVPPFAPAEAPHIVGGTCVNGHVSYYDARVVCQDYRPVAYGDTQEHDELIVPCREAGCRQKVVLHVHCRAIS